MRLNAAIKSLSKDRNSSYLNNLRLPISFGYDVVNINIFFNRNAFKCAVPVAVKPFPTANKLAPAVINFYIQIINSAVENSEYFILIIEVRSENVGNINSFRNRNFLAHFIRAVVYVR